MIPEEKLKLLNHLNCSYAAHQMRQAHHEPMIIALGGSHSYGTNVETSDVDIRGVYRNSESELLGMNVDKEQYVSAEPDMCLYSLKKTAWLMAACNPAMIEILNCRNDDYLYVSKAGRELIENRHIFYSKKAMKTFGGYARSQLNRLVNRSGRAKNEIIENEERSFEKSFMSLVNRHKGYVDQSASIRRDGNELFLSFSVKDMPVHTVSAILSEFDSIDRNYRKSVRNDKAQRRDKLSKHMMHLIRLYIMGEELMRTGDVHTYREEEHDLLMSIRNGDYLEADKKTPTAAFNEMLEEYKTKFEEACEITKLPDEPDMEEVNKLIIRINKEF